MGSKIQGDVPEYHPSPHIFFFYLSTEDRNVITVFFLQPGNSAGMPADNDHFCPQEAAAGGAAAGGAAAGGAAAGGVAGGVAGGAVIRGAVGHFFHLVFSFQPTKDFSPI